MTEGTGIRIAVVIPCFNEGLTIAKVVRDAERALPGAVVHVCDNGSEDDTAEKARAAGAVLHFERRRGKAQAVQRLFADVEADVYVLVDGDDTYTLEDAPRLVRTLLEGRLDLVNGRRCADSPGAFRPGHRFGNWFLSTVVAAIFGRGVEDMLSGFKVFSRRFVKSFPSLSKGFGIETELLVHALELGMPMAEVETAYRDRPPGSRSKLATVRDGWRILLLIAHLVREERPLPFFGFLFVLFLLAALALGLPVVGEFLRTGLVPRLPTALLATGLAILAFSSLVCGLVLDTVTRGRKEMKRLRYLAIPGPGALVAAERGTGVPPGAVACDREPTLAR